MGLNPTSNRRGLKAFKLQLVKASLINEVGFFTDVELEFSEIPEILSLQKSAAYVDQPIPGRTEPWKSYSHSNPTVINFSAKLVAQGTPISGSIGAALAGTVTGLAFAGLSAAGASTSVSFGIPGADSFLGISRNIATRVEDIQNIPIIILEVQRKADWLLSLVYAQYDDQGRAFPPPLVDLVYGSNFTKRGVVKDVQLIYMGPWEPNTLLSQRVEAKITFEEVNQTPKSYLEVRNGWNPLHGGLNRFVPSSTDIIGAARSVAGI